MGWTKDPFTFFFFVSFGFFFANARGGGNPANIYSKISMIIPSWPGFE